MAKKDIQKKAEELSLLYKTKVTPVVFIDLEDKKKEVVGYIKAIPLIAKYRIMDSVAIGGFSACASLLDEFLLAESDPRIKTIDEYNMGAVQEIYGMVTFAVNQFKKK